MPDVFAGRFELLDPVGAGGTGTVWRAWDNRLERLCAAKVLRQRHAGALLRFVREQGLRLNHPNVLSPYSWAADDDQALLAMDLVGGGSVSSLSADFGALPERYAAELLAQLLGALEQVHAAGLVHRDVKPANLLLEATGTGRPVLRLSDFGIALDLSEPRLTQHGAVVGTPGYLAPEVLAGEPPSTGQDLYAAGVTGWQLLTGDEPPSSGSLPGRPDGSAASLVWDVVEGLLRTEGRTESAAVALKELAPVLAVPLQLPAYTRDGELIEVFNQLPPPPPPHEHPTPPATTPAATTPRATTPRAATPAGATPPRATTRPAATPPAVEPPATPPRATAQPAATPRATTPRAATPPAVEPPATPPRATTRPAATPPAVEPRSGPAAVEPHPGRPGVAPERSQLPLAELRDAKPTPANPPAARQPPAPEAAVARTGVRRRIVLAAAGLVALAAVGAVAVRVLDGGTEGGGSPPSPSASSSPGASTGTVSTPATIPTGPVTPVPNPQVKLGAACGWQEAGSVETTADGTRVECRQQGSVYRWLKAG